jgi:hypothetical protein
MVLLLAAIVVWNTVHLQACVRKLRSDDEQINDEDLQYLSPLLRHHIGITGSTTLISGDLSGLLNALVQPHNMTRHQI